MTLQNALGYGSRMRPGPVLLALAALGLACSKPPKTTVDVDTMREASFVKDIKDDPAPGSAKAADKTDDAPVPAATGPAPAQAASTPNLPPTEILSQRVEKDKDPPASGKKPTGSEKITKAECTRLFDRFFDLVLEGDERFRDLGADGKGMVRQIAAQDQRFQSLQKDCESDVSRTKYNCGMAAKSSGAWQTCLK